MRESGGHIIATGDVAEHDVVHVGIHASATALTTVILDVVFLAIGNINLTVNQLVSAKDDSWSHAPHKKQLLEAFIRLKHVGCMLFHREIEYEPPHLIARQFQLFHSLSFRFGFKDTLFSSILLLLFQEKRTSRPKYLQKVGGE